MHTKIIKDTDVEIKLNDSDIFLVSSCPPVKPTQQQAPSSVIAKNEIMIIPVRSVLVQVQVVVARSNLHISR